MSYQDVWVRGVTERQGQRECQKRYAAIASVLSGYERRFTMLDLGASEGYFSFRAATDFDCVAVMVEGGRQLRSLCEINRAPRTILLEHRVSLEDLERLAASEHFDVVLALNVLHHFADPERAVKVALALGDRLIVETPPPSDAGACGQSVIPDLYRRLSGFGGKPLALSPSHTADVLRPMWLIETPKRRLSRPYVDSPDSAAFTALVEVVSTLTAKRVRMKGEERDWLHGINLRTYQRMGGAYPPPSEVARMVEAVELPAERHGDIRPWNMVFDGETIRLIDGRDERAIYQDAPSLAWTARQIRGLA